MQKQLSSLFSEVLGPIDRRIMRERLERRSYREAKDKNIRLRRFFRDPYEQNRQDPNARWWDAEFALDYLEEFKPVAYKKHAGKPVKNRKDGTQPILHELNPQLFLKACFKSRILPSRVNYKIVRGRKIQIPFHDGDISKAFVTVSLHDIDEDFVDGSPNHFKAYRNIKIQKEEQMDGDLKAYYLSAADHEKKLMQAMTFGRRVRLPDGSIQTQRTYNGDINLYIDAFSKFWSTLAAKITDRFTNLTDRYGEIPDYFTIEKDDVYRETTRIMFMQRQLAEKACVTYPELESFFDLLNARLELAYRMFDTFVSYHPSYIKNNKITTRDASTARIDLNSSLLERAFLITPFMEEDEEMFSRMLFGFECEAVRYPQMRNLVMQMERQLLPYLKNHRPEQFLDNVLAPS